MPKQKAYRFDAETIRMLNALVKKLGETQTAVWKRALRLLAKSEGIE